MIVRFLPVAYRLYFICLFILVEWSTTDSHHKAREKAYREENLLLAEEDQVRDHLGKLDTHKSMGPHGMHP